MSSGGNADPEGQAIGRDYRRDGDKGLDRLIWGEETMRWIKRFAGLICCVVMFYGVEVDAQQAFGQSWNRYGGSGSWERFYHYPYVYYPQNYWGDEYFKSRDSMYYRYPPEMRIPVYNKRWHNYYPSSRLYHSGHHFHLDVF